MFGETCYDMVFHGTMRAVQWWSKLVFISFTLIICGHILMSDSRHKAVVFIVLFMGAMACLFSHLLAIAAAAAAGKSAAYFYPRFGKRSLPLVMGSAFIGPIAVLLLAMAGAQAAAVAREREREIRDL